MPLKRIAMTNHHAPQEQRTNRNGQLFGLMALSLGVTLAEAIKQRLLEPHSRVNRAG